MGPGAERARELIFQLSLQLWARRAQMTPVAGKSFRKVSVFPQIKEKIAEKYFSKVTPVQMGGVLQYRLEVYCGDSLASRLRSQQGTALQMGGVLLVARYSAILRYYSCYTPPIARYPSEGSLTCDTPPCCVQNASKCQCDRGLHGGYSAVGCYTCKTKSDRV